MNANEIWAHFLGSLDIRSVIYAKKMGRLNEKLKNMALERLLK